MMLWQGVESNLAFGIAGDLTDSIRKSSWIKTI